MVLKHGRKFDQKCQGMSSRVVLREEWCAWRLVECDCMRLTHDESRTVAIQRQSITNPARRRGHEGRGETGGGRRTSLVARVGAGRRQSRVGDRARGAARRREGRGRIPRGARRGAARDDTVSEYGETRRAAGCGGQRAAGQRAESGPTVRAQGRTESEIRRRG